VLCEAAFPEVGCFLDFFCGEVARAFVAAVRDEGLDRCFSVWVLGLRCGVLRSGLRDVARWVRWFFVFAASPRIWAECSAAASLVVNAFLWRSPALSRQSAMYLPHLVFMVLPPPFGVEFVGFGHHGGHRDGKVLVGRGFACAGA
jgi:hypothetical protein